MFGSVHTTQNNDSRVLCELYRSVCINVLWCIAAFSFLLQLSSPSSNYHNRPKTRCFRCQVLCRFKYFPSESESPTNPYADQLQKYSCPQLSVSGFQLLQTSVNLTLKLPKKNHFKKSASNKIITKTSVCTQNCALQRCCLNTQSKISLTKWQFFIPPPCNFKYQYLYCRLVVSF